MTTVILTRPAHRNAALAGRLQADGIKTLCLPALGLESLVGDASALPAAENFDLLVFVSSHAASQYLELTDPAHTGKPWPRHLRLATVGRASAEPLYQADFVENSVIVHPAADQSQDSEALWQALQPFMEQIRKVLVLRGQAGREWLGERFERAGVQVTRVSLYRRVPQVWGEPEASALAQALQNEAPVFLLTSSESVDAIYANVQRLGLVQAWSRCRFVAIHDRISSHLQSILQGSGLRARHRIGICAPCDDAMYRALRSAVSHSESH